MEFGLRNEPSRGAVRRPRYSKVQISVVLASRLAGGVTLVALCLLLSLGQGLAFLAFTTLGVQSGSLEGFGLETGSLLGISRGLGSDGLGFGAFLTHPFQFCRAKGFALVEQGIGDGGLGLKFSQQGLLSFRSGLLPICEAGVQMFGHGAFKGAGLPP